MEPVEALIKIARARHERIGFVNGCFDLFHDGHKHLLKEARKYCDLLVVAINSDRSVSEKKGHGRPRDKIKVRFDNLMPYGDIITTFDSEKQLAEMLGRIRPDVMVKGDDYKGKPITGAEYSIVVFVPRLPGISTTEKLL